jgi:succinyl-CoA synthetase beta subunit
MTGKHLINKYTPKMGLACKSVLIMEEVYFSTKHFLSLSFDSKTCNPVLTYSKMGGHPLDRLLTMFPDAVRTLQIDIVKGIDPDVAEVARLIAEEFECPQQAVRLRTVLKNMYSCFIERDCLTLTLNPFVVTEEKDLTTLGCRIEIDDSAVFRQAELFSMIDYSQMLPSERIAHEFDIKYVCLEGNIGVLAGSAGSCLATNDMLIRFGGNPANFVDMTGQAYHEQIEQLISLFNWDDQVKVVLLNCFGGAMPVDKVANSLIAISKKSWEVQKPIVCRLRGEGEELAK